MAHYLRLPLWVDAISINQDDLEERASQVQLMGNIYKTATTVFAWIRETDLLRSKAFEAVGLILDYEAARMEILYDPTKNESTDRPELMELTLSTIPDITILHWFALSSLLQRLYFRRAWIAQEVIFA